METVSQLTEEFDTDDADDADCKTEQVRADFSPRRQKDREKDRAEFLDRMNRIDRIRHDGSVRRSWTKQNFHFLFKIQHKAASLTYVDECLIAAAVDPTQWHMCRYMGD